MICYFCDKDKYPEEQFKPVPKDVMSQPYIWCPDCDKKDMLERLDNEARWSKQ